MLKNFVIRAISGLTYAALMISAFIKYDTVWPKVLFAAITVLGLREFYSLTSKGDGIRFPHIIAMLTSAAVMLNPFGMETGLYFAFVAIALIFIVELFRNKQTPIQNISLCVMGLVYVTLPMACLTTLPNGYVLFAFFLMIWGSDTGAYLVGMCIGKHKMFERISPKKTWEGFFGGFLFALAVGYLAHSFQQYFEDFNSGNLSLSLVQWLVMSVAVFIFGTLGDLVESLFKRELGVKDSGNIMPGHGGILDRFDSAIIAAPVAVSLLKFFGAF